MKSSRDAFDAKHILQQGRLAIDKSANTHPDTDASIETNYMQRSGGCEGWQAGKAIDVRPHLEVKMTFCPTKSTIPPKTIPTTLQRAGSQAE